MRQLECGLSCKSCEGCPQKPKDELLATASIGSVDAVPGDVVEVESNSANVYLASLLMFILPCVGLVVGYLLGAGAGFGPFVSLLCSAGGLVLCFLPALLYNSRAGKSARGEFTVINVLR